MSTLIHFPNIPLYQHFFFSLHPTALQRHHNSYPTAVVGHSSDRVPISVPRPWAVPPSVGGLGDIPPPQHVGTTPALSHLGRPFPMGHAGKGHTLWSGVPGGLWSRTLPLRAPAACPAPALLPLPVPVTERNPGIPGNDRRPPLPRSRGLRGTPRPVPASGLGLMSPDVRDSLEKPGVPLAVKQPTRREEPLFAPNLAPHSHPTSPPAPSGL